VVGGCVPSHRTVQAVYVETQVELGEIKQGHILMERSVVRRNCEAAVRVLAGNDAESTRKCRDSVHCAVTLQSSPCQFGTSFIPNVLQHIWLVVVYLAGLQL